MLLGVTEMPRPVVVDTVLVRDPGHCVMRALWRRVHSGVPVLARDIGHLTGDMAVCGDLGDVEAEASLIEKRPYDDRHVATQVVQNPAVRPRRAAMVGAAAACQYLCFESVPV